MGQFTSKVSFEPWIGFGFTSDWMKNWREANRVA